MTLLEYPMRAELTRNVEDATRTTPSGRATVVPTTISDVPCYVVGSGGRLFSGGEIPVRRTDLKVISIDISDVSAT